MRKRILLIAVPLVIVAIAASVAVASPSDAEHSRGPRLDKLHAERPIAASDSSADLSVTDAAQDGDSSCRPTFGPCRSTRTCIYLGAQVVGEYITSLQVGEYVAAVRAAEEAQSAEASQPVSSAVYSNTNPGDFLSCVRNRESGGNYGVYNSGGSGAAGAYQFMPGTWNSIAASSGRGDLVGVDPAQAAPADQDAMAQALYAQQGAAPWGGGC